MTKIARHAAHIEAKYGITREEYRSLYAFQAGKCAICCRATGASKRLAVDHDHKCDTGAHPHQFGCRECVRGLLCSRCNEFLGHIRDDARAGERIARYLRTPPFRLMMKGKK